MQSFLRNALLLLLALSLLLEHGDGLIHHLKIRDDRREAFFIESFGFEGEGKLQLNCSDFQIDSASQSPKDHRIGFVIKRTMTNYQKFIQDHPGECLLDVPLEHFEEKIMLTNWAETYKEISIRGDATGIYSVYYVSCDPFDDPVSYDLSLVMFNPGPDYLSTGESPTPTVYSFFFLVYLLTTIVWLWMYLIPHQGTTVYTIHYLMTISLLLKMGAVFFHAVELHFLKLVGHPGGWTWVYLVFSFLKGVTFFVVIGLIGTGWAFIKPYLTDRDTKVFLVVIPLQVIANLALVILEETSPGSQRWFTWHDIFRFVDIICCIAILLPILNSINHLKHAAGTDGKAKKSLEKLSLFKEFYMLVITYVYFTRIIVYLLDTTLLFRWIWVSTFVEEMSTWIFIVITGFYFRPEKTNLLMKMDEDEDSSDLDIHSEEDHS